MCSRISKAMLFGLCILAPMSACQTPANTEATPSAAAPVPADQRLSPGPLADEELRRVIFKGLEARLTKTQSLGEGSEEATEIGDSDNFKFMVTRLSKAGAEITPDEAPDEIDVDVTGWYKVTVSSSNQPDPSPACTSFDASVSVVRQGSEWRMPDDKPLAIGREDSEDCF